MAVVLAFSIFSAACSGDAGPMGPEGPAGPAGPPGPAGPAGSLNRTTWTGTLGESGGVSAPLPSASVSGGKKPVIACYISDDNQVWFQVAQTPSDDTTPLCALTGFETSSPDITLLGPVGWFYYIIAVW